MNQISLFDGTMPLKIDKPLRLIECFAGYGSQALSLKYLGAEFEHWKIAEWAVKSIQAYKDMHFPNDNTDYSAKYSKEWLIDYLYDKGISADYNKPMKREQIARMGEEKIRTVYNNIIATHNLVSVTNVKGKDLEIADTDKYTYILTYSFPCQDLSSAGLSKGMAKGSGTRSGLLWEIERILDECEELPQILLMENVPEVIGAKNSKSFSDWFMKLESLGYKSWYKVMNAKDYEMPQNRERCFMVSALGDYYYEFPNPKPLRLRLKNLLEDNVEEKYYISDKALHGILNSNFAQQTLEARTEKDGVMGTILSRDYKDPKLVIEPKCEQVGMLSGGKWDKMHDISRRVYSGNGLSPTLHTCGGGNLEPKIAEVVDSPIPIRSATKSGYELARGGDLAYPDSATRRGRVGKGVAQTLMTSDSIGVVEPLAYDEQNRYIRQDGTVGTLTTDGSSPKHNNRVIEPTINKIEIPQVVKVRKYEVKSEVLVKVLREQKHKSGLSNQEIADKLNLPLTKVEHWFRTDDCFSIPDAEIWINLKQLLGMEENKDFDKSIMTFEEKIGVFEKSERHYFSDGLAPTLTTLTANEKIITPSCRIRKLTPKECFRLMGVKDEDFERAAKNQSNSSLYHLAGDSIVTNCLMEIFKEML